MKRSENDDPEKVILLLIQTKEIHIFAKISEKSKKDLENIFVLFLYEKFLIFLRFSKFLFLCFYFVLSFSLRKKKRKEIVEELNVVNKNRQNRIEDR